MFPADIAGLQSTPRPGRTETFCELRPWETLDAVRTWKGQPENAGPLAKVPPHVAGLPRRGTRPGRDCHGQRRHRQRVERQAL